MQCLLTPTGGVSNCHKLTIELDMHRLVCRHCTVHDLSTGFDVICNSSVSFSIFLSVVSQKCVCVFVGSCLATKVFYSQFTGYRKGVGLQ